MQIEGQQQGTLCGLTVADTQADDTVGQPTLADAIGLDSRLLAIFSAAQHIQPGEVHRRGTAGVLHRFTATIEVGVDHPVPIAQASLGLADLQAVTALQRL